MGQTLPTHALDVHIDEYSNVLDPGCFYASIPAPYFTAVAGSKKKILNKIK